MWWQCSRPPAHPSSTARRVTQGCQGQHSTGGQKLWSVSAAPQPLCSNTAALLAPLSPRSRSFHVLANSDRLSLEIQTKRPRADFERGKMWISGWIRTSGLHSTWGRCHHTTASLSPLAQRTFFSLTIFCQKKHFALELLHLERHASSCPSSLTLHFVRRVRGQ